ncbi:MAG: hypothetical protein SF069_18475 [Phycisphaerae bacterium]|nr:hypothetical protein [Phycisphaerae bacterium]
MSRILVDRGSANWCVALVAALSSELAFAQTGPATPSATPAPAALPVSDAEYRAAQQEASAVNAKVALLEARRALLADRWGEARERGQDALRLLRTLPTSDRVVDQILIAEGVVSRASQALARKRAGDPDNPIYASDQPATGPTAMTPVGVNATPAPTAPTGASGRTIVVRNAPAATADAVDPVPPDDATAVLEQARRGAKIRQQAADDAATLLNDAEATRLAPRGANEWVEYPPDFMEKAKRREARYPGGMVARGGGWTDANGSEWYMGVYDISDLIYMPPDFVPPGSLDPREQTRIALDREAFRQRFFAFGGAWPGDLHDAIPLLRYFGGVDDLVYRGPKYSIERQQQIEEMVRVLLGQAGPQAQIISLPPVQQRP